MYIANSRATTKRGRYDKEGGKKEIISKDQVKPQKAENKWKAKIGRNNQVTPQ